MGMLINGELADSWLDKEIETGMVDIDYIKRHCYFSHSSVSPSQIISKGPALDFSAPHDRAMKFGATA